MDETDDEEDESESAADGDDEEKAGDEVTRVGGCEDCGVDVGVDVDEGSAVKKDDEEEEGMTGA